MPRELPAENIYAHTKKLRFLIAKIEEEIASRSGVVRVLDFGCGNGSAIAQYLIRDDITYVGVDLHRPSIEYAQAHFGRANASFRTSLPEAGAFDVIVVSDVLEHLDAPAEILRSLSRLASDDCLLVGAVPNGYGPFEMENRIDRYLRISRVLFGVKRALTGRRSRATVEPGATLVDGIPYNMESGHVQFFTRRQLTGVLDEGGFQLTELRNGAFVGAPLSERLLLRGEVIARANAAIAGLVPPWLASTWYFAARRKGQ